MNEYNPDQAFRNEAGPCLADALFVERRCLEAQLNEPDSASTQTLRFALRRYRSLSRQSSPY
jgi:hypothetical protein